VRGTGSDPALAAFSSGPSDLYLKLDGITGESAAVHHVGEIEVNSVQWGVSNLYAELDLEGVRLTSVSDAGARHGGLTENLQVHFLKVTLKYRTQSPTGTVGSETTGCWNLVTKAAC
jgi:type VI protein secretion system component Hcp